MDGSTAVPDPVYVKIRSYHIVRYKSLSLYLTLCGRYAEGPTYDEFLVGKSCESCLRIFAHRQDA